MNVPCRDNLCALQKEAWLPGGADPWAELGFQPCRWLLERGNPVQHSQACSEIWDLLMAAASPLSGRAAHAVCGSVQNPTGGKQQQSWALSAVQAWGRSCSAVCGGEFPKCASLHLPLGFLLLWSPRASVVLVGRGVVLGVEQEERLRNAASSVHFAHTFHHFIPGGCHWREERPWWG